MSEVARTPARGLCVRLVLLVIGSAPLWTRLTAAVPGFGVVTRPFDAWFLFQCHREANRSLFLLGALLPVCARCLGIYLGLGLGAVFVRPRLSAAMTRLWVALAALVMVLDVLTETLGMRPEWAPLRILTGVLLSYPVSVSLIRAASSIESAPLHTRGSDAHEQL